MNNYGRFGALLGTVYIGHTHCKFLVSLSTVSRRHNIHTNSIWNSHYFTGVYLHACVCMLGLCRTQCRSTHMSWSSTEGDQHTTRLGWIRSPGNLAKCVRVHWRGRTEFSYFGYQSKRYYRLGVDQSTWNDNTLEWWNGQATVQCHR